MPATPTAALLDRLWAERFAPADDARLLRLFASDRDERAFAELVRRHGPMVLGVCRRVLGHRDDADDAFQATWLVLARKARAITRPTRLVGWLHTIAVRTALETRRMRDRHPAPGPLADVANPARPTRRTPPSPPSSTPNSPACRNTTAWRSSSASWRADPARTSPPASAFPRGHCRPAWRRPASCWPPACRRGA